MSVELIKKIITLDEMTKKESSQVVKKQDLIVPDGKPDMQKVVEIEGKIKMDPIDVTQDRVMYRGNIDLCILYRAVDNSKCMCVMKGRIPFEDVLILEGVNKDQRVDFDYEIEHISYSVLNERKLHVETIMKVEAKATGCKDTTIITKVESDDAVESEQTDIEIVSLANEKEDKVIIREELAVPQNKDCIGEIIKTNIVIKDEQVKRIDNEIKYSGMLELATMYKSVEDDEKIEIITHRMMFEGSIEDVQRDEEAYWDYELDVEPIRIEVAPDYDGEDRIIECECVITASYHTYNKDSYNTVADIYCPGKKVNTKESSIEYMNLEDKVSVSMPKKEVVELGEYESANVEVYSVVAKPMVEEKSIEDNRLMVKGIMEIVVVCLITNEEGNNVEEVVSLVPFAQELSVKKGISKPYIEPRVKAKSINIYTQTKKELVVEYILDCMVDVYSNKMSQLLEEVELQDMTKEELDSYPSMTVYQVGKNDTLWILAKKFNTTVKDILEINDMEVTESLKEGQKIIILKKIKM